MLTPDQALASVAGRLVSLPAPPSRSGRRWLVPVEFISRALALIYDARLDLRKPSRLLVVGDVRVPRIHRPLRSARRRRPADDRRDAAREQHRHAGRANALTRQVRRRRARRADAAAAAADLAGRRAVRAATSASSTTTTHGDRSRPAVRRIPSRPSQPADATTRLVIDLRQPPRPTPRRASAAGPRPPPPPPPELPPALGQPPASAIRTIAIDPGHGGDDEGVKRRGRGRRKRI